MPDPTKPLNNGNTGTNNLGFLPDNYLNNIINEDLLIQENNRLASNYAKANPNSVVQQPINNDKIDFPNTDNRSANYVGNPNWAFAAPNMTGKQRADAEAYHRDIIGGELLGLGAERLIGSAFKGASKLVNGTKSSNISKVSKYNPLSNELDNFIPNSTPKEVPFKSEINWSNWNKEIPDNKSLLDEYANIEQTAKQNGTWMKNADGSKFEGLPEQFVQQQSGNFKRAFGKSKLINPDGSPTIQYHGSAKKFDTFDESKFQLGDSGYSGQGIYTIPSKTTANSYATSSAKFHKGEIEPTVYELYGQANNPISSSQLIKENSTTDLFNFHRKNNWKGKLTPEESLMNYDAAIADQLPNVEIIRPWNDAREIVFPTNKQLKSATGNNGMFDMNNPNIYKALVPAAVGGAALQAQEKPNFRNGGIHNINRNNISEAFDEMMLKPYLNK